MDLTDVNGCDEVSIGGPTPRSRESRRQTMVSLRFQLASQQASIRSLQDVHSKQGSQRGNSAYFGGERLSSGGLVLSSLILLTCSHLHSLTTFLP